MDLKDFWKDKVSDQDNIYAEDINAIAQQAIKNAEGLQGKQDNLTPKQLAVLDDIEKLDAMVQEKIEAIDKKTEESIESVRSEGEKVEDSLNDYVSNTANAIKGTASGEVVALTDVSPIKHTMGVRVSGVENPESVTVVRCGKNIFGYVKNYNNKFNDFSYSYDCVTHEIIFNGSLRGNTYINFMVQGKTYYPFVNPEDTVYTLTAEHLGGVVSGISDQNHSFISVAAYESRYDYSMRVPLPVNQEVVTKTGHFEYKFLKEMVFFCGEDVTFTDYRIRLQLEVGDTATEYEPFFYETYTPNTDGIVEGVTYLHPNTTFLTDTEGAVIECEYNQDTNKALEQLSNDIKLKVSGIQNEVKYDIPEKYSNAIKGTAKGTVVVLPDVSPTQPYIDIVTSEGLDETYYVTGQNVWDEELEMVSQSMRTTGSKNYIRVAGGAKYYFCCTSELPGEGKDWALIEKIIFYDGAKNEISRKDILLNNLKIDTPIDCRFIKFELASEYGTEYRNDICINVSDERINGTYVPYQGITSHDYRNIRTDAIYPVTTLFRQDSTELECTYNKDINKVLEEISEKWELFSSGELTREVASIQLSNFSCSKIVLKMKVFGSDNNATDNTALTVFVNSSTNSYAVKNNNMTSVIRNSNTASTNPYVVLELKNKSIVGQLFGTAGTSYGYLNREDNEDINYVRLAPDKTGIVFGVGTTYELWGVRV